jgi:hypothetical protein
MFIFKNKNMLGNLKQNEIILLTNTNAKNYLVFIKDKQNFQS